MKKGILFGLLFGIIVPWILSALFLTLLTDISWTGMTEGVPQVLAILSFSSVAFSYNVPIFGHGYVIPLFIWILTGLFCGLCCKSVLKGALMTLVGLGINILLFVMLTTINPDFIASEFTYLRSTHALELLGGFSTEFFVNLGLFLCWYSLILPGGVLGGIMGGMISRTGVVE